MFLLYRKTFLIKQKTPAFIQQKTQLVFHSIKTRVTISRVTTLIHSPFTEYCLMHYVSISNTAITVRHDNGWTRRSLAKFFVECLLFAGKFSGYSESALLLPLNQIFQTCLHTGSVRSSKAIFGEIPSILSQQMRTLCKTFFHVLSFS